MNDIFTKALITKQFNNYEDFRENYIKSKLWEAKCLLEIETTQGRINLDLKPTISCYEKLIEKSLAN